jgi:hypothetical protein
MQAGRTKETDLLSGTRFRILLIGMALYCCCGFAGFCLAISSEPPTSILWAYFMLLAWSAQGYLLVVALVEDNQGKGRKKALAVEKLRNKSPEGTSEGTHQSEAK